MNEVIVLGGGCFWCTEAIFQRVKGVIAVTPGYAGGETTNPTYNDICGGKSGHAEVAKVEYDAAVIPTEQILRIFFLFHNPTTSNRQGADVGSQYRSIILYTNEVQRAAALSAIAEVEQSKIYDAPVVTEVKALEKFYPAEKEHINFYQNNQGSLYCQAVISPKLGKLRAEMKEWLVD